MIKIDQFLAQHYFHFDRAQLAALRHSTPIFLSEEAIIKLKIIDKDLSMNEVRQIYLPLLRLVDFYISSKMHRQAMMEACLGIERQKNPYIIGITGSVAVGKSITACLLQELLNIKPGCRSVELITTDGFLYPNKVLNERGLMKKKGFPESYDLCNMLKCISEVKSGAKYVTTPIYSHLIYDVVPYKYKVIKQPDILILEGLNILQSDSCDLYKNIFISDFIDFSIYIDAPEALLQNWYTSRFMKFRHRAFSNPDSYFHNYSKLSEHDAINVSTQLWTEINSLNLRQNILPTRERSTLIITKSVNHVIESVRLRK